MRRRHSPLQNVPGNEERGGMDVFAGYTYKTEKLCLTHCINGIIRLKSEVVLKQDLNAFFYRSLVLKWTTINPEEVIELMQSFSGNQLPLAELSGLLKEVGVRKNNLFCLVQWNPAIEKTPLEQKPSESLAKLQ